MSPAVTLYSYNTLAYATTEAGNECPLYVLIIIIDHFCACVTCVQCTYYNDHVNKYWF